MLAETITLVSLAFPGHGGRRKSTRPDRPRPPSPPGHRRKKKHCPASYAKDFDPWIEGYEARHARLARSANPYSGLDSRQLWDDGWMDAEHHGAA